VVGEGLRPLPGDHAATASAHTVNTAPTVDPDLDPFTPHTNSPDDVCETSPLVINPGSDDGYDHTPTHRKGSTGIGGTGSKIGALPAVLSLVRASVGPGAMALPYAFSQSGISVGLALLVSFTVIIYTNSECTACPSHCSPTLHYASLAQVPIETAALSSTDLSFGSPGLSLCTPPPSENAGRFETKDSVRRDVRRRRAGACVVQSVL
jgi:hypothetical protein